MTGSGAFLYLAASVQLLDLTASRTWSHNKERATNDRVHCIRTMANVLTLAAILYRI